MARTSTTVSRTVKDYIKYSYKCFKCNKTIEPEPIEVEGIGSMTYTGHGTFTIDEPELINRAKTNLINKIQEYKNREFNKAYGNSKYYGYNWYCPSCHTLQPYTNVYLDKSGKPTQKKYSGFKISLIFLLITILSIILDVIIVKWQIASNRDDELISGLFIFLAIVAFISFITGIFMFVIQIRYLGSLKLINQLSEANWPKFIYPNEVISK